MNNLLNIYIGSMLWPLSALIISIIYYILSDGFIEKVKSLNNNKIIIRDKSIPDTLIRHLGEIGLVIFLLDKVNSTIELKYNSIFLAKAIWLWSSIQIWLTVLIVVISLYSYARLAIVFGSEGRSTLSFTIVLLISLASFTLLLVIA